MTESRRVVVTGIGVVSAIGIGRDSFWRSLSSGESGLAPLEPAQPALGFSKVAAVRGFDPGREFPSRQDQGLDRTVQFGLLAANEAIADSGLAFDGQSGRRAGVVTGCSMGGAITLDASYERIYGQGKRRLSPTTIPNTMPSCATSIISMRHGLRGPSFALSGACAASSHALGIALSLIRSGAMDFAVAGGNEAPLNLGSLVAWDALRAVSPTNCRPFCRDRDGMTLGEGAAMLVLESRDLALGRGARIYAELAGFGMTADAHHLTAPSVEGPAEAMRLALCDAGLGPDDVDYINAHGTGTESNDLNEARAFREVFGDGAHRIAVGSTKSMHGHTLGAAGALEAVATVLAIHYGLVPPTPGAAPVDPEIDLDVSEQARPKELRAALSNSFAFGGLNAVLAFRA